MLSSGTTIICSRYAHSGVAYSNAKSLEIEWCMGPDRGLIRPDLVIYLDLDVKLAAQRANYGKERYDKLEFQRAVQKAFVQVFAVDKQLDYVRTVDAAQPVDQVHQQIRYHVGQAMETRTTKPIEKLWKSMKQ